MPATRARTQPPAQPTHSNSASSTSSQRAERNTRSNNKQGSPQKSSTPNSLSFDELSDQGRAQTGEPPQRRRSKRQQDHDEEDDPKLEDEVDEDGGDGEGAIRCICGHPDYPGPALDGQPEAQIDFVMCDSCNQWQHGGCVGIYDESMNPDEYFCEECKPDLHQVAKGRDGQKYSRYLPVWEKIPAKSSHRKTSVAKTTDNRSTKGQDKNARTGVDALTKRRSTMNSRAAYDEEEVLRKVLEESKTEGQPQQDNGNRRGKRSRDESEDAGPEVKRQRTRSDTPSSQSEAPSASADTDDKLKKKSTARGAVTKSQREKELRDRERERAEAAGKRKGRADRRRAEDSDPPEDPPKPTNSKSPQEEAPTTQLSETAASNTMNNPPPRRGSRQAGGKRGGRGGRLARDQDIAAANDNTSPTRRNNGKSSSSPKDANGTDGAGSSADSGNGGGPGGKKGRPGQPRDPTMAELKKRAAAMIDYIAQSQIEMARWNEGGLNATVQKLQPDASGASEPADDIIKQATELATKLVKWQDEYGK